jgi:hypothetical protein
LTNSSADLAERIRTLLVRHRIPFDVEPSIGGVRPDFLIETRDGRTLLLEAKSWSRSRQTLQRAQEQATFFKDAAAATDAWIVLVDTPTDLVRGVASFRDLVDLIQDWQQGADLRVPTEHAQQPYLFAAMPFDEKYDDVHFAMVGASHAIGLDCLRIDHEEFTGPIIDRIHALIRSSVGVICDLSESNPNVTYEVGYAHGLRLRIVAISSTRVTEMPFNVRGWNTVPYQLDHIARLRKALEVRLRAVFGHEL